MFPSSLRGIARVVPLAAVLAGVAAVAHAGDVYEAEGVGNLVSYSSCATGLAASITFAQAWAAILICAKVISDEWKRTF